MYLLLDLLLGYRTGERAVKPTAGERPGSSDFRLWVDTIRIACTPCVLSLTHIHTREKGGKLGGLYEFGGLLAVLRLGWRLLGGYSGRIWSASIDGN